MSGFKYALQFVTCFLTFLLFNSKAIAQSKPINFKNCKRCIVLAEQSVDRVAILDLDSKNIIWEWLPKEAIKAAHQPWFKYPSDAKPVYDGKYILTTASGGAVTLIRIADKKVVFYAYAGGNTHSAEVLPDGNIVSASSNGNFLTVFSVDTANFPDNVYTKNVWLPFGHNVVWDKKGKVLWSAGKDQLKTFTYNFNKGKPDLFQKDSIAIPGNDAHDLFPVFGQRALWLTNTTDMYQYDLENKKLNKITAPFHDIKSVSTGLKGYPTLLIHPDGTKNGWWTDEINSLDNQLIFKQPGLKMYKARWYVKNDFSY